MRYSVGDRVEAFIPQADDPDHQYHGKTGEVVDVFEDDLSEELDNPSRGFIYTVEFEDSDLGRADFRFEDLDPVD